MTISKILIFLLFLVIFQISKLEDIKVDSNSNGYYNNQEEEEEDFKMENPEDIDPNEPRSPDEDLPFYIPESQDYDPLSFSKEWQERMSDYEPNFLYLIEVPFLRTEIFYENIQKVPAKIRGAFLLEDVKRERLEFVVLSSDLKLIYKNITSECVFEFTVDKPGEYIFKLKNLDNAGDLRVTFTMNTGQHEILSTEHLTNTELKLNNIYHFLNSLHIEEDFMAQKQRNQKRSKKRIY